MAYFDHNATTPVAPGTSWRRCQPLDGGLRQSVEHPPGRAARPADGGDRAAATGHALSAAPRKKIVFTSGGTEANNLALAAPALARCDERHRNTRP
jgi:cysteine sulfinate desulfinase/cysteine desulfurase-like protein